MISTRLFSRIVYAIALLFQPLYAACLAAPVIVPDRNVMRIDDIGLYGVGYALRGGPEVALPIGWVGGLDSPTGPACESAGDQNGDEAWLMHPPWKGKTGITFQDFTFRLPHVSTIVLTGATALRADAVGKSDGATFRIFVNGTKVLDISRGDSNWLPFSLNLTSDAGKTVKIRFETDPGPRDNSAFDFALWGDRLLTLTGYSPQVVHHPVPLPLPLRRVISKTNGSVVPLSGYVGTEQIVFKPRKSSHADNVGASECDFLYRGPDGLLIYRWQPNSSDKSLFGDLSLSAKMRLDKVYTVPLAGQASLEWTSPAELTGTQFAPSKNGDGAVLTRTYLVGGKAAEVAVVGTIHGKSLVFDITCSQPYVQSLNGGAWGPVLRRQAINIPYYSLPVWFLGREDLFTNTFLDWTVSQASNQDGTRANYLPMTNGSRNLLKERLIYTAAWQLDETLPNIPNPVSPYREDLSRRIVLDIWGGSFAGLQARLNTLAGDGMGPAVAIIHNWQFGGYDNMLPKTMPANVALGGNTGMKALVAEGKLDHILMALHENYTDYYPNYPGFATTDIARNSDGSRLLAWLNPGTKIQSFAVKPTRILALAATQSPLIAQQFGTDACYIDVMSAVPPWFHVDFQAGVPMAGEFESVWDAHRALWAYERSLHQGPVLGEGNNQWYWSGYLDGVEAQFGQGWGISQGTSAPLLVDFDLLRIHPLQLNHGMGYYERWWDHAPNPQQMVAELDEYRMQEAAYGHEGFVGDQAAQSPNFVWLESHLLPPMTARTAIANPVAIDYWSNGKWLNTSAAAKVSADWSRVRVRYSDGLTLWANGSATPFAVGNNVLPRWGWLAKGDGLAAGTTVRNGVMSDMAETATSLFVNARPIKDWQNPGQVHIRPSVEAFAATGPRSFRVTYKWAANQALAANYDCFVHFVPASADTNGDNIAFQQDHPLPKQTSQWKSGEIITDGPWNITLTPTLPNGDYLWTIGLYRNSSGRLTLEGTSDAEQRIVLGTLHVQSAGLSFVPTVPAASTDLDVNTANSVLNFGTVQTNGSVFLQRIGNYWTLRPFPTDRPFTVLLNAAVFGAPPKVRVSNGWWRLNLSGASTYRWPAQSRYNNSHGADRVR